MELNLSGKHAVVCGSTQGIGLACAKELALLGATICLVARNEEKLALAVKELDTSAGQKHSFLAADFQFPVVLELRIKEHLWKTGPAHILINNTGGPPGGPITAAKQEDFLAAFQSHLLCNHVMVQATMEGMKEAGYGRIINIISTSVKQPLKGLGVSNTIRAAVANWSKTMSLELSSFGITVNNVLPGATSTQRLSSIIETKAGKTGLDISDVEMEMMHEIPAGRFGKPEEIAAAVAFLASPAAAYINGINLPVDGGRTGCL